MSRSSVPQVISEIQIRIVKRLSIECLILKRTVTPSVERMCNKQNSLYIASGKHVGKCVQHLLKTNHIHRLWPGNYTLLYMHQKHVIRSSENKFKNSLHASKTKQFNCLSAIQKLCHTHTVELSHGNEWTVTTSNHLDESHKHIIEQKKQQKQKSIFCMIFYI